LKNISLGSWQLSGNLFFKPHESLFFKNTGKQALLTEEKTVRILQKIGSRRIPNIKNARVARAFFLGI
jgi:hypothetical protein